MAGTKGGGSVVVREGVMRADLDRRTPLLVEVLGHEVLVVLTTKV